MFRQITSIPFQYAVAIIFAITGALILLLPEQLLLRMSDLQGAVGESLWLAYAYGAAFLAIALAFWLERRRAPLGTVGPAGLTVLLGAVFVMFTMHLGGWWIDDAGITFAYSRSLADGDGVTFWPGAPPTEGYSSSLWMTVLALARKSGFDIPIAAKILGISFGLLTLLIAFRLVWAGTRSPLALVLTLAAVSSAPFVVWVASGQEHALQALLLILIVYTAMRRVSWRLPVALLLSLLVLTRPEAPLIVIAVFVTAVGQSVLRDGRPDILHNLSLAAVPFAFFLALLVWRLSYFGDPLPNPYYAKTSVSSLAGLANPLGGGWQYVLDGLRDSGLIVLLPLAFLYGRNAAPSGLPMLLAVLAGHMAFVLWAKGDWMGQYRFLMPILAVMVLPALLAPTQIPLDAMRQAFCTVTAVFLLTTTVSGLDRFAAQPTTPLAVVSEVGANFARLSRMLEIEHPLLAHHDAGGISYDRSIGLLDLGGLVDRDVAKHMDDRDFLETYVFEARKPDFIFGALNFAAASGFTEAPAFAHDYVPLEFVDEPVMTSELSHIRRDRVRQVPGLDIIRDGSGVITRVMVQKAAP